MTQTEIEAYDAMMADRDSWKERFLRLAKEKALCPSDATTCSAISDTERLDWLQTHQETAWRVTHDEWEQTTETHTRHVKITVFDGWVVNEHDDPKKDIRAAIDSAINPQNETSPSVGVKGKVK